MSAPYIRILPLRVPIEYETMRIHDPKSSLTKYLLQVLTVIMLTLSFASAGFAQNPIGTDFSLDEYLDNFCMRFQQASLGTLGPLVNEMRATQYDLDEYFTKANCQTDNYSEVVKSPLLHYVVDQPSTRRHYVEWVWLYYLKTLKKPELFTNAVNASNTKGETFLDYLETLRLRGINTEVSQQPAIELLIDQTCQRGGKYNIYKRLTCPTPPTK